MLSAIMMFPFICTQMTSRSMLVLTRSQMKVLKGPHKVESCLQNVKSWMSDNYLKLNTSKTEVLVVSSSQHLKKSPIKHLEFDGEYLVPSTNVRNLGVMFDSVLNMESHVNHVCKSVNYHLRNIWKVRRYLTKKSAETLIHAIISSKIDYCNSLYYNVPNYLLQKLQRLQNTAARIITGSKRTDHVTPSLFDLHWLPVRIRTQYKLLITVFKILNGLAPSYLHELISPYKPTHNMRSACNNLLVVPPTRLKTFGDKAFSVCAPKLWNSLPLSLRDCHVLTIFKQNLKKYLFNKYFQEFL